jgi:hypothetical protein
MSLASEYYEPIIWSREDEIKKLKGLLRDCWWMLEIPHMSTGWRELKPHVEKALAPPPCDHVFCTEESDGSRECEKCGAIESTSDFYKKLGPFPSSILTTAEAPTMTDMMVTPESIGPYLEANPPEVLPQGTAKCDHGTSTILKARCDHCGTLWGENGWEDGYGS